MSQARVKKASNAERRPMPPWLLPAAAVSALATVVVVAALHWLPTLEGPAFESLVIKGERRQLTAEALGERVRPWLAEGYFGADLEGLRRELEAEPWVASVSLRRQWPSTLELTIKEQVPVAVWNRSGFLNEEAVFFVPRDIHRQPGFLPELSGPEGSEAEVLAAWRDMRQALAAEELEIAALELSARRAWVVTLEAGPRVYLGRRDHKARFRRFARIALPALASSARVSLAGVDYIDMRYTNGFSVAQADARPGVGESEDQGNG